MPSPLTGKRIRAARLRAGLTQEQLARRLGKTRASVVNYELGRSQMPGEVVARLSRLLGVTADFLLGRRVNGSRKAKVA